MFDVKNRLKLRQVREEEALLMQLRNFNYEELTEWAANYIGEHLKVKYEKNATVLERIWMRSIFDNDVAEFIHLAEESRYMHIALKAAIKECMIQNFKYEPALELWYQNAREDGPPKSKVGRPLRPDLESHIYRSCIERMKRCTKFKPVRNEMDAQHQTLCDIVAVVTNNSYSYVKTAWMTRDKDVFSLSVD